MTRKRWKYCGDVSIRQGGYYWRHESGNDYASIVRVTPCADAGGPDNLFWVSEGTLYLDAARMADALECIGADTDCSDIATQIDAMLAYSGMDRDSEMVVQIGPMESDHRPGFSNPQTDKRLRSDASLRRYVRREFLRG